MSPYRVRPTQIWLGARGAGWPNKRLGAARTAESVVPGTNARAWLVVPGGPASRERPARRAAGAYRSADRAKQTRAAQPTATPVRARASVPGAATRSRSLGPRATLGRAGAQAVGSGAERCAGMCSSGRLAEDDQGFKLSSSCSARLRRARRARTFGLRATSTLLTSATSCACRWPNRRASRCRPPTRHRARAGGRPHRAAGTSC